ncbi:MAG: M48 family metallopeptidase, partial [Bacteroidales bacterium]
MAQTFFYIIVGIIVFNYVFDLWLEYINVRGKKQELPKELEGIYNQEQYAKQINYERVNYKFDTLTSTFSFFVILIMLFFGGFAYVDSIVQNITQNVILQGLLFFGILMFASDILNIPFEIWDTFVIEEKFGFNKTTPKTFILDKIKGWLIAAIIGGGLLAAIIWLITYFGNMFWLYAWILLSVFMIFMTMFYSNLIVPLFNKQTPLEDGELKNAINDFSLKAGFTLDKIFKIDGSKRSTKANAYFSGLGAKKRIVLFDTLINDLTKNEIVAVLAHEIGHYKKKHTLSMIIISLIQTGILLFILGLFIKEESLSQAIGAQNHSIHMALFAFSILYTPLTFIIGIFMNIWSR